MANLLVGYGVKEGKQTKPYRVVAFLADGIYWRVRDVRPAVTPDDIAWADSALRCDICGREAVRFDDRSSYCEAHQPREVERVG